MTKYREDFTFSLVNLPYIRSVRPVDCFLLLFYMKGVYLYDKTKSVLAVCVACYVNVFHFSFIYLTSMHDTVQQSLLRLCYVPVSDTVLFSIFCSLYAHCLVISLYVSPAASVLLSITIGRRITFATP